MLETHENADEAQKAKPHEKAWGKALAERTAELKAESEKAETAYEKAWETLMNAAPDAWRTYDEANEAKRALESWQRIAPQVAR